MAKTTASFVHLLGAEDDFFGLRTRRSGDALRARSGVSADDANSRKLGHFLGDRQELRHRAEGLTSEIHVETGDNYADAAEGELLCHLDDRLVEKLSFVDPDDAGVVLD